jgi:ATP-dependent DNA helicase RecG
VGGRTGAGEGEGSAAAALATLVPPLRFACRNGFAGVTKLAGFGKTLRAAVERARAAGAADSPALRRLEGEAEGFDALPVEEKRRALGRIVADVAALVPVPDELAEVARAARVEGMARPGRPTRPSTPAPAGAYAQGERIGEPLARGERIGEPLARGERTQHPFAPSVEAPEAPRSRGAPPAPAPPPPPDILPDPATPAERAARRKKLQTPLAEVPKVHPAPRALLEERDRKTVEAALELLPRAYEDRTTVREISTLRPGDEASVLGTVQASSTQRTRTGRPMLKARLTDGRAVLELVFFNAPPWKAKQLTRGASLLASGRVAEGFGGRRQMANPEIEPVAAGDSANFGRIVPVYPGPAGWQHPALRKLLKRLCDEWAPHAVDDLPAAIRERRGLLPRARALREVHFPPSGTDLALAAARASPAFRRLVFEELFFLQLALALRRRGVRAEPGIAFDARPEAVDRALARLPFALTGSQRKALAEISRDMGRPEPMNRLLQGDVGSGKTAVAFAAMMLAVQSGWQAALMVPTEILAEQHARTLGGWLRGTGVEIALVGATARGKAQKEAREAVRAGRARIAVGTHALVEEAVGFEKLGLVVVDEQHRFGVLQRARLMAKGRRPDVLVMTATPIPRTLALAFYGDLDQSKISELPPGRTPVETEVFGESQRRKAHDAVRAELEAGRQAFVVYPLVAESEKSDLADATTGAAELARVFAPHPVGLLHGQMKADEKQAVMERFRRGELRVLVATTVIEVGVDVPNATVMVVEHAERFGLSQLHQLRGRVGRGAARSRCLLVARFAGAGADARERLRAMEDVQDGFELARRDLALRGQGDLLGTRQSGEQLFEVADLYRDEAILDEAREEAFALVEADPALARPEHLAAAEALRERWAGRLSLARVG